VEVKSPVVGIVSTCAFNRCKVINDLDGAEIQAGQLCVAMPGAALVLPARGSVVTAWRRFWIIYWGFSRVSVQHPCNSQEKSG
jgi:hypothetical protein